MPSFLQSIFPTGDQTCAQTVSLGIQSTSQGSMIGFRWCPVEFKARRVFSQDWGHKDATKAPSVRVYVPLGLAG